MPFFEPQVLVDTLEGRAMPRATTKTKELQALLSPLYSRQHSIIVIFSFSDRTRASVRFERKWKVAGCGLGTAGLPQMGTAGLVCCSLSGERVGFRRLLLWTLAPSKRHSSTIKWHNLRRFAVQYHTVYLKVTNRSAGILRQDQTQQDSSNNNSSRWVISTVSWRGVLAVALGPFLHPPYTPLSRGELSNEDCAQEMVVRCISSDVYGCSLYRKCSSSRGDTCSTTGIVRLRMQGKIQIVHCASHNFGYYYITHVPCGKRLFTIR